MHHEDLIWQLDRPVRSSVTDVPLDECLFTDGYVLAPAADVILLDASRTRSSVAEVHGRNKRVA